MLNSKNCKNLVAKSRNEVPEYQLEENTIFHFVVVVSERVAPLHFQLHERPNFVWKKNVRVTRGQSLADLKKIENITIYFSYKKRENIWF